MIVALDAASPDTFVTVVRKSPEEGAEEENGKPEQISQQNFRIYNWSQMNIELSQLALMTLYARVS